MAVVVWRCPIALQCSCGYSVAVATHRAALVLSASAAAVGAYAAVLVIRPDVAVRLFDVLGFGPGAASIPPGAATEHVMFTYRVLGAVLLGWMVLVGGPRRRGGAGEARRPARGARVPGCWFFADTGVSLLVEETEHAFFNVAFLSCSACPLPSGGGQVGVIVARLDALSSRVLPSTRASMTGTVAAETTTPEQSRCHALLSAPSGPGERSGPPAASFRPMERRGTVTSWGGAGSLRARAGRRPRRAARE
jgi:hypothetical protein